MSTINLTLLFSHPDAQAHRVRYARIDNISTPVWTTVSPDPITSPANIAVDVPNGQYEIRSKPIYADGRICDESVLTTEPCPGLISINAYINGDNLIVQYVAPPDVPQVRFTVNYPNGGSAIQSVVNNGADFAIALPNNLFGDFSVSGQSVCDPDTNFYSSPSTLVTVSRSPVSVNATLNFQFIKGSFTAFNATLSTPIASAITINQMFADGYSDAGCTIEVASATKTTSVVINAGNVSTGATSPSSSTGDWNTATKYTMYNVVVNGSPVNNGDVLTLGSDTVIVSIPSCV